MLDSNICKHKFVVSDIITTSEIIGQKGFMWEWAKWFRPKKCDDCGKRVRHKETEESYYEVI